MEGLPNFIHLPRRLRVGSKLSGSRSSAAASTKFMGMEINVVVNATNHRGPLIQCGNPP